MHTLKLPILSATRPANVGEIRGIKEANEKTIAVSVRVRPNARANSVANGARH